MVDVDNHRSSSLTEHPHSRGSDLESPVTFSSLRSPEIEGTAAAIERKAADLRVSSEQLSAMTAVVRWSEYLKAEAGSDSKQLLETYFTTMGFLPEGRRILSLAQRGNKLTERMDTVVPRFFKQVCANDFSVDQFLKEDPVQLRKNYPELSKSQLQLLQSIMKQQAVLDSVDIGDLARPFPFPITTTNFFGRFLAGGCEETQKAVRLLQITTPFFIRMRELIEGLSNPKRNILTLWGLERHEEPRDSDGHELEPPSNVEREAIVQAVESCVRCARDFLGGHHAHMDQKIELIELPKLPDSYEDHIEKKERAQFAVELMDWLFFGKADGELLNRRSLSLQQEKDYQDNIKELDQKKQRRKLHNDKYPSEPEILSTPHPKRSDDQDSSYREQRKRRKQASIDYKRKVQAWETARQELDERIKTLKDELHHARGQRRRRQSVRTELEDSAFGSGIRKFRKAVAEAQQRGSTIVFSGLKYDPSLRSSIILRQLDAAMNARKYASSRSVKLLRASKFMLGVESGSTVRNSRVGGYQSISEQRLRPFRIQRRELTHSLQYVIAGILPKKEDPKVTLLKDHIRENYSFAGIQDKKELSYLVRQHSGKRKPAVSDYLEYSFENASYLTRDQLIDTLKVLRELGESQLSPRCETLLLKRFRQPAKLLREFEVFNKNYNPDQLGALSPIFQDLGTLEKYLELGFESFGMKREVDALEQKLDKHLICAVVDGTNYHPELGVKMGDEGVQETDADETDEVWGNYIRPPERLIRSFARRLMEGNVCEGLQNHSLITVKRPEKEDYQSQAIIKRLFGIDVDVTIDLAEVNGMLEDLTVFDDNTILVIDAESVSDLGQLNEFLTLFKQYRLKVIVRTREPFPGMPQVLIQPFSDYEVPERLEDEMESLKVKLDLKEPISSDVLSFTAQQVRASRRPSDDPLNLNLMTLASASQTANLHGFHNVSDLEVVSSLAPIFHKPDAEMMRARKNAIDVFVKRAPEEVLGQREAIETIGKRVKSHILGLRDPQRPLSLIVPGPTGVGKTELAMRFAMSADIPFFHIEGSQFNEPHSLARLVGSPSGYVGPDEGVLVQFAKKNTSGMVFADEIEKMHPEVFTGLMNWWDTGTLTSGSGDIVRRPGFINITATNAGAHKLHRFMTPREVRDCLSEHFVDQFRNKRPELIARLEPVMMLAIEELEFKRMLFKSLEAVGSRYGFIHAGLRLVDIDPSATEMLFEKSKEVCELDERKLRPSALGFSSGMREGQASDAAYFHDLRHPSRAIDELAGESIQEAVDQQYSSQHSSIGRRPLRHVKLVGFPDEEVIKLIDTPALETT